MASYKCGICKNLLVDPLQLEGCGHLVCSFCLEKKCSHGVTRQAENRCLCPVQGCTKDHRKVYFDRAVQREISGLSELPGTHLQTGELVKGLSEPLRTFTQPVENVQDERRETGDVATSSPIVPLNVLQEHVGSCLLSIQEIEHDCLRVISMHCDVQDVRRFERRILEAGRKCKRLYSKTGSVQGIDFGCEENFHESSCQIRDVNRQNLMLCKDYNLLREKMMDLILLYRKLVDRVEEIDMEENLQIGGNLGRRIGQQLQTSLVGIQQRENNQRQVQATESLLTFCIDRLSKIQVLQDILEKDQKSFEVGLEEKNKSVFVNATWCLEKMSIRSSFRPFVIFSSRYFPVDISKICMCISMEDGVKVYLKYMEKCNGIVRGKISCIDRKASEHSKDVIPLLEEQLPNEENTIHLQFQDLEKYFVEDKLIVTALLPLQSRDTKS